MTFKEYTQANPPVAKLPIDKAPTFTDWTRQNYPNLFPVAAPKPAPPRYQPPDMPFKNQQDQVAATVAAANALGFSLPTAQAEKAVTDYQTQQIEKFISDQAAITVAEANALGFSVPQQQAEQSVRDYYEQRYKKKQTSNTYDPVAAITADANAHGFSLPRQQAEKAVRDYYAYNDPVSSTVLDANALGFSLPKQQAKDAVTDYYINQFGTYGTVPFSEQVKAQIIPEAIKKYAGLDDEIRDLDEQAWTGTPIDMARYESLKATQAKIDKVKEAAQAAYMAQPAAWTESELKAQGLKETDPDQYRTLAISDDYINDNWQHWLELAQSGRLLTTEERKEAKEAAWALSEAAVDLYWSYEDPSQMPEDVRKKYETYGALEAVLESKESKGAAAIYGALEVLPVDELRQKLYANSPWFKESQDSRYNDADVVGLLANSSMAENAHAANPGWYTAGNIAGNAAAMAAGGAGLSAVGVTKRIGQGRDRGRGPGRREFRCRPGLVQTRGRQSETRRWAPSEMRRSLMLAARS